MSRLRGGGMFLTKAAPRAMPLLFGQGCAMSLKGSGKFRLVWLIADAAQICSDAHPITSDLDYGVPSAVKSSLSMHFYISKRLKTCNDAVSM